MKNIGLIGKMGAGKTTAADILINTHGYVPISFAAPLKAMVIEADPLVACGGPQDRQNLAARPVHLSDVLDSGMSFEEAKRTYPELRRALQRIGQGARKIDPDFWIKLAVKELDEIPFNVPVVVTDVRYPNEVIALAGLGFKMVRITRKPRALTMGDIRTMLHDSETSLDGYAADVTIANDGTLAELVDKIEAAAS